MTAPSARLYVAGLPVVRADVSAALDRLWEDIERGAPTVYVLVNAYSATLRRRPAYSDALFDPSTTPLPDGASLTLGAELVGHGNIGRCPGPDLFEKAAERAATDGTRFFLLGGGEGVAHQLAQVLARRFPGIRIVGSLTPPFGQWTDAEERQLVRRVQESGADVLWLGVSAPKQEVWASKWRVELARPIVCVGAAFDFLSGRKRRAPRWMRDIGAEWVFRLLSEPRRLLWRYVGGNSVYLFDLLRYQRRPPLQRRPE
jgi:N-acetylglucosaminyldiphosphoundecaprenol N-acetyl-beta-D-mannosaminyltransferase